MKIDKGHAPNLHPTEVRHLDADINNADWTKSTWDLPDIDNIDQLLEYLQFDKKRIKTFMQLPVYKLNLESKPWLNELNYYV